jgi:hypothetical protein
MTEIWPFSGPTIQDQRLLLIYSNRSFIEERIKSLPGEKIQNSFSFHQKMNYDIQELRQQLLINKKLSQNIQINKQVAFTSQSYTEKKITQNKFFFNI